MVLAENLLQTKLTLKAEKEYLQKNYYETKRSNVRPSVSCSLS